MKKDDKQTGKSTEAVELENKLAEATDKYLRALADYQNLEKQTEQWRHDFSQYAGEEIIKKLLDILGDLEKAEDHLKDEGLTLVIAKLKSLLASEGLEELNLEGQEFDPKLAEVVSLEPGEKPNTVIKVLSKGYKLKDKMVRPAKVVVSTT